MKIREKIKKVSVLCLIFLLSINSFATSISNNDGSAFITKAEFDALKSSFQSQIDTYNQSIDSKIDTAIASYLKGIRITKELTENIIFNDYGTVTAMNGAVKPEFRYPNVDVNIFYTCRWDRIVPTTDGSGGNGKMLGGLVKVKYPKTTKTWGTNETNRRALVTNNVESGTQTNNMVWNGVALRYQESYTVSRGYQQDSDMAYGDKPATYTYQTNFFNPCALLMNSYLPNFYSETTSVINPSFQWQYKSNTATTWYSSDKTFTQRADNLTNEIPICTNTDEVQLVEMNGKTKELEHIIQWDKSTTWTVSNEKFLNTFRQHSSNSYKSKGLYNSTDTERVNQMDFFGMIMNNGYVAAKKSFLKPYGEGWLLFNGSTTVSDNTDKILPSIGMLSADQAANKIYQHDVTKDITSGGVNTHVSPVTLEAGMQLLAAKKDAEVSWDVEFSKANYYTGSAWDTTKIQNIIVVLSLAPFTDKDTAPSGKKLNVKVNNDSTLRAYAEISSKKGTIKWKMPEDGLVYVKWYPKEISGTVSLNNEWQIDLDVNKSNKFTYVLADE